MKAPVLFLPLLISATFMMESLESAMLATALPTIATDLQTDPVQAKVALTSYFLTTAALIPLASWLCDRFGPRPMFTFAIAIYTLGTLLGALALSFNVFVGAKMLQGTGGALMFPIGRMILVRSVSKADIVRASSYLTIPSALAPIVGPLLAGYFATYSEWRFIFLINVPLGIIALVLALIFIPEGSETSPAPFDWIGFFLSGVALVALGFGLSTAGSSTVSIWSSLTIVAIGAICCALYVWHSRKNGAAILDLSLFRFRTFRIAISSSFIVRAGVVGALPFLLSMMLQVGFGLTAFESGAISFIGAVATLAAKLVIASSLRLLGFKNFLVGTAIFGTLSMLFLGFISETTSRSVIMAVLFTGTLFRVLQIMGLESMIFAEVPKPQVGQASCLLSVSKQLAASVGVAYAALILHGTLLFTGQSQVDSGNFQTAMMFLALPLATTIVFALRLSPEDGDEVSGFGARPRLERSAR